METSQLTDALQRAATVHDEESGGTDPDWPRWYTGRHRRPPVSSPAERPADQAG